MDKKTWIAIALSFAVILFYPFFLHFLYPDYHQGKSSQSLEPQTQESQPLVSSLISENLPENNHLFSAGADRVVPLDKTTIAFNPKGGSIREVSLLKYFDQNTQSHLKFLSLSEAVGAPTLLKLLGLSEKASAVVSDYTVIQDNERSVTAKSTEENIQITKHYAFRPDSYAAELELTLQNASDASKEFHYQLFVGPSITQREPVDAQYIESNFSILDSGKEKIRHIKLNKLGKKDESGTPVIWAAVKDRHFSIIVKPESDVKFTGLVEGLGNRKSRTSLMSEPIKLHPGDKITHKFLLYIGPNDIAELEPLGLGSIVNFGKLDGIGKLLVGGLELLHKIFRNYGIAIIALTALINLMLFPLTRVSYMSMKRMQLIQPQMTKLREKFKDSPEKLNKEMMQLYKKHKVNPFGGCLPMIMQMPIFIALYVALSKAVILRNSGFLWVKDLSSPDVVSLPFHLPFLGDTLHILPIVMMTAMFVQQKFTQIQIEGQDPAVAAQQKTMAVMMPLMFGFIFYGMPSGLVLYWLTNTLLMALYQFRLKKMTLS